MTPFLTQFLKNSIRYVRSATQEPRGFREGYATFSQLAGTLLSRKESNIFSRVIDMTTKPLMAFFNSARVFLIVLIKRLNWRTSWYLNTSRELGFSTRIWSRVSGISFKILSANLKTISSGVSPEALFPALLGYPKSSVSKNSFTVFYSKVMLAFVCNPKTSGSSSVGNESM